MLLWSNQGVTPTWLLRETGNSGPFFVSEFGCVRRAENSLLKKCFDLPVQTPCPLTSRFPRCVKPQWSLSTRCGAAAPPRAEASGQSSPPARSSMIEALDWKGWQSESRCQQLTAKSITRRETAHPQLSSAHSTASLGREKKKENHQS